MVSKRGDSVSFLVVVVSSFFNNLFLHRHSHRYIYVFCFFPVIFVQYYTHYFDKRYEFTSFEIGDYE